MFENTLDFARKQDKEDSLASWRNKFYIPVINDKEVIYLTGNSLGLQPKSTKSYIEVELNDWAKWGVEGHFLGTNPWYSYHENFEIPEAKIVGALPHEVAVMNTLTTNLHLLMVSFYRPTKERNLILVEAGAFPSDQYAVESQVRFHGFNPETSIIEVSPEPNEHSLRTEKIIEAIEKAGSKLALVMMGGVNYYTGQAFDMQTITDAAHRVGAKVGFDLAHAAGNIEMKLHDWDVDFAVWCTYKYLNSGPGGVSGIFVNERYANQADLPRFAGWWGYDKDKRFLMEKGFKPMYGAAGWQLSNAQILPMATHKASLDMFDEVGMANLRQKSKKLTSFMAFLIQDQMKTKGTADFEIITPSNPEERGAQLSLLVHKDGKALFQHLTKQGIVADWREPNVIRVAPAPFYNSFEDVYRFVSVLFEK